VQYDACNDHPRPDAPSLLDVWRKLLAPGSPLRTVLVSSGDVDPVVSLHGTEAAVAQVGFPAGARAARRPWFFNASSTPLSAIGATPAVWGPLLHAEAAGAQLGGFTVGFAPPAGAPSFSFLSVRGSGHMVPAYAPQKARHILHRALLRGEGLAPPLPADWADASEEAFYARPAPASGDGGDGAPGLFAQWVTAAMAPPYVV
jgi:hypothetical protein